VAARLILLAVAAFAAGVMNALAGGGSFLTFPALMLTGLDKNDVEGLPASAFGKALARPRPAAKKK